MSRLLLPPPSDLGAPAHYTSWRPQQELAFEAITNSPKRFFAGAMPTGFGKSLVNAVYALAAGGRAIYLTSTKGLQNQLQEFRESGLVDIRGMSNYECLGMDESERRLWSMSNRFGRPWPGCDEGPCHSGKKCELKDYGCLYYDANKIARVGFFVSSNYSYWLAINRWGEGLGEFDTLVLDEAHEVPSELSAFLKIEISDWELSLISHHWPRHEISVENWTHWAHDGREKIDALIARDEERGYRRSERRKLKHLDLKFKSLGCANEDWITEKQTRGWSWEPIWPAPYAEEYLFRGIKKVIFSSATMRPKTLELLGLKPEDYDFHEYPSSFPLKNRPVIHLPTVRVDKRIQPGQMKVWLGRIDQIIKDRTDRKGIIHTVSYERAREIVSNSRFSRMMLTHANASEAKGVIERFRVSKDPCILVSPSVTTGYDFPADMCRYQIIGKIAFPDTRSAVMKARQAADKDYGVYLALVDLVQSAGRAVRSEDDWAETFVIDDHMSWVVWKFQRFVPKWFLKSVASSEQIPKPMTR